MLNRQEVKNIINDLGTSCPIHPKAQQVWDWLDENVPENKTDNWDLWDEKTWNKVYDYLNSELGFEMQDELELEFSNLDMISTGKDFLELWAKTIRGEYGGVYGKRELEIINTKLEQIIEIIKK